MYTFGYVHYFFLHIYWKKLSICIWTNINLLLLRGKHTSTGLHDRHTREALEKQRLCTHTVFLAHDLEFQEIFTWCIYSKCVNQLANISSRMLNHFHQQFFKNFQVNNTFIFLFIFQTFYRKHDASKRNPQLCIKILWISCRQRTKL